MTARNEIYRHRRRRRRRAPKHGSAWQIGKGPVSMLKRTTVLVGMMRGLYGHAPIGTLISLTFTDRS
jgi:hypothetical protein